MYWCCFVTYTIYNRENFEKYGTIPSVNIFSNTVATIGDIGFLIADWIFVESYFSASLSMPIAIAIFRGY